VRRVARGSPFSLAFGGTTNTGVYTVDATTNPASGSGWSVLHAALPGSNGVLTVSDAEAAALRAYRVRAHVP
jgi:hypothetical protein